MSPRGLRSSGRSAGVPGSPGQSSWVRIVPPAARPDQHLRFVRLQRAGRLAACRRIDVVSRSAVVFRSASQIAREDRPIAVPWARNSAFSPDRGAHRRSTALDGAPRVGDPMNRPSPFSVRRWELREVPQAATTALLAFAAVLAPAPCPAQPYAIARWTIDGGGASLLSAGSFHLSGTIGQFDAGVLIARPDSLTGGFWGGGGPTVTAVATDPTTESSEAPRVTRIFPVAPNPVRRNARIAFDIPDRRAAEIAVFDVAGTLVRTLARRQLDAGHYTYGRHHWRRHPPIRHHLREPPSIRHRRPLRAAPAPQPDRGRGPHGRGRRRGDRLQLHLPGQPERQRGARDGCVRSSIHDLRRSVRRRAGRGLQHVRGLPGGAGCLHGGTLQEPARVGNGGGAVPPGRGATRCLDRWTDTANGWRRPVCSGTTRFVLTSGSVSGTGSSTNPYFTPSAGIAAASAGGADIVLMRPGAYAQNITVNKPVTLRVTRGGTARIGN